MQAVRRFVSLSPAIREIVTTDSRDLASFRSDFALALRHRGTVSESVSLCLSVYKKVQNDVSESGMVKTQEKKCVSTTLGGEGLTLT